MGEAGELANKWKKVLRGDGGDLFNSFVAAELGDVLWYLARLADECGYTLEEIASYNLKKLADRKARGALTGAGDDR